MECSTGNELVPYSSSEDPTSCDPTMPVVVKTDSSSPVELSWDADWAWTSRIYSLLVDCVKVKIMLAWYSTLGGAHSALGDSVESHAQKAGVISRSQLVLAGRMGDHLLASRYKLYAAHSLLQRAKLSQAAKIIKEEYHFLSKTSAIREPQLEAMCLSMWKKLQYLHRLKHLKKLPSPSSLSHHIITLPFPHSSSKQLPDSSPHITQLPSNSEAGLTDLADSVQPVT